jgi:hypothetical protein
MSHNRTSLQVEALEGRFAPARPVFAAPTLSPAVEAVNTTTLGSGTGGSGTGIVWAASYPGDSYYTESGAGEVVY